MLVLISRCDDEAQAGFQCAGAASAEGGKASCARRVEVGGGRQLGETRQTVAAWEQRLSKGGQQLLKRGTLGRPRQLTAEQERELAKMLMAVALAAGYPAELWTLPRIGKVITERFGGQYSTGHLWHLLRHPAQRRGDRLLEAAHVACAQKNPAQRPYNPLHRRARPVRTSQRGAHLEPARAHSRAAAYFTWKQLSAAGLSFWQFYFRFFPGAIRSERVIEFLGALRRQIKRPLLIIWDGVVMRCSRKVRIWPEGQGGLSPSRACPPVRPGSMPWRPSGLISKSAKLPICASISLTRLDNSPVIASNPCSADLIWPPPFGNRLNWLSDVMCLYDTR